MSPELIELAIATFVTLFVVIDPVAVAPIFASMTEGTDRAHQKSMAYRGTIVGTSVLLFFALIGESFLGILGISMDAFRVAGGMLLFLIAMEMVFEQRTERRQKRADKFKEEHEQEIIEHPDDISVFPIAVPLLSGPGSIATVMLMMSGQQGNDMAQATILATIFVVMIISLGFLLMAGQMMKLLGAAMTSVITRVLGIVLAAMAAQFVLDGVKGVFVG